MATELEVKLTLSESAQSRAFEWLKGQPGASEGPVKTLVNRYYDTPNAGLNQARAALRVRQAGDRYIQTLKTQALETLCVSGPWRGFPSKLNPTGISQKSETC